MAPAQESSYPTMCYGCRATAVIRATLTDPGVIGREHTGRREVVWCESCAQGAIPVLAHAGVIVTVLATCRRRPDACDRAGCSRLAQRGRPFCTDHIRELVDAYAEPATPAGDVESWHIAGELARA